MGRVKKVSNEEYVREAIYRCKERRGEQ